MAAAASLCCGAFVRLAGASRRLGSVAATRTLRPRSEPSIRLRIRRPPPPARRLQVRAARMEPGGVGLGFRAPHFELEEPLTGKTWSLDDFEAYPALLVMFICNHCPFVVHLKKDIVKLANFYMKRGLAVVAISSNSTVTHPQDGPEFMAEEAKSFNYPFPYLYDQSQAAARAFGAVCTPEFFLFKKDGRRPFELFYHGQFDDSRPRLRPGDRKGPERRRRRSPQRPAAAFQAETQYGLQHQMAS